MSRGAGVAVIGGGVIGCAIAWELAKRDVDVVVLERGRPGGGATGTAGGMLSPLAESPGPGPFLEMATRSLNAYPDFVAELEATTRVDTDYRTDGKLALAFDDEGRSALRRQRDWQVEAGFEAEWLDGPEAVHIEPALGRPAAALHIPWDHRIDTRRLGRALWIAASDAGARFRLGTEVVGLATTGGRVTGLELADGDAQDCDAVVVAAGCWSGRLGGLPGPLPVTAVRGEIVVIEAGPPLLRHTVTGLGRYLVPRSDGRILVGATEDRVGFDARLTAGGTVTLLQAALRMAPSLAGATVTDGWAGLRPGTPDDLPVLGRAPGAEGLLYATGHYRNGILLAPETARMIADAITRDIDAPTAFSPDRFQS